MRNTVKIYVIYGNYGSCSWIESAATVSKIEDADVVLLTGGGDIHPSFYHNDEIPGQQGLKGISSCYVGEEPSSRDLFENSILNVAIDLEKPIIGICRGAQWLCVKAGGTLIQHNIGHSSSFMRVHDDNEDKIMKINSIHHQLLFPFFLDQNQYEILGVPSEITTQRYILNGVELNSIPNEVELAYFKKINGLAIQFHPEMMSTKYNDGTSETINYLNKIIKNKLLNGR